MLGQIAYFEKSMVQPGLMVQPSQIPKTGAVVDKVARLHRKKPFFILLRHYNIIMSYTCTTLLYLTLMYNKIYGATMQPDRLRLNRTGLQAVAPSQKKRCNHGATI